MTMHKPAMQNLARVVIPLLAVVAVASVGTYSLLASHADVATAHFSGTITQDGCAANKAPAADQSCTITVGDLVVSVMPGTVKQAQVWGSSIGFASLTTDYTGRNAEVYAAVGPQNAYTLEGSTTYYIKLLPLELPPPASNIQGSVSIKSSAGTEPFKATIAVQTTAGALVTSFTSGSDGSFSVPLAAGTYVLVPQTHGAAVTAPRQTVTVTAGNTTNLTITYTQ